MDIKKTVIDKLAQYLSNEIKREELYNYVIDLLHEMLTGDIFYLKNIEIWGILTEMAEIDDTDDHYCHCIAKKCYEILAGLKNSTFIFAMCIPQKYTGDRFAGLKEILLEYAVDRKFSSEAVRKLNVVMKNQTKVIDTVNDFLEAQIIDLLKLGYMFCGDSNKSFALKSSIFVSDEEAEMLEESVLNKIIMLLECYSGKKSFFVQVVYKEGSSNISVLV